MSWLWPARRAVEATAQQVAVTGAAASSWNHDPLDGDAGWKPAGSRGRPVPDWTLERSRMYSVAAYRCNPMARAIIDTYVAFAVGDSGVTFQATNTQVRQVVEEFWRDPRNQIAEGQELGLRSQLLLGETIRELMVGELSGVVRYSPIDPTAVVDVRCRGGNPLWPEVLELRADAVSVTRRVAGVDDTTGLRDGEIMFWAPFRSLETDIRSLPFLTPVLDWLDSYDTVLSNLIDRTALARYMVWDVTVEGDQPAVDKFVRDRGGLHVPPSGSVEVHNSAVKWEAKNAQTGSYEDTNAARSVLTSVAAGAGLSKVWLAEPEDANRATSLTMAEPVRRRVQGVQKIWLAYQTEFTRFAVDRAVAAGRLPRTVQASDPKTGESYEIPASQSVVVTGPEIAAADSQVTAQVLLNLSTGIEHLVAVGALTREAAAVAARKAWEDYMGIPYSADLGKPDADLDDVATAVDDATTTAKAQLKLAAVGNS
ncbi:hypothetical protein [Nonomuraea soli]|uniref:Phage portal protein n=1 Tax=Nonomuraea soli TaxID=1032476 RepID=A0A7W0HW20_9ACTN|nr:hypothetical protein [Nonomuraea soli]MBA2897386.1 hypothetical protein [Nonomuraea soli]